MTIDERKWGSDEALIALVEPLIDVRGPFGLRMSAIRILEALQAALGPTEPASPPAPAGIGDDGCPCKLVEPCGPSCSCANDLNSGACGRCAKYGSEEQRMAAAKRIAAAIEVGTTRAVTAFPDAAPAMKTGQAGERELPDRVSAERCGKYLSWAGGAIDGDRSYCSWPCRNAGRHVEPAVPVTPTCEPWCGTNASVYPVLSFCTDACKAAGRSLNPPAAVPPAVPGEPPETEQSTWELVTAPLDCEEDEDEYNPRGFWLGNKETNRVFILPGDMGVVRRLLLGADAHASRPLAVATELLRRTHMCATARPDGTCDGCDIGDFLAGAASPAPGSVSLLSKRVLAAKCPACRARIGKPCWTWSDDDEPTVCLARLRTAEASTPPTLVGPGIRDAVLEEAAMAADGPACARQCRHDDCKAFRIVASRIRALKSTQTSGAGK